MSTVEALESAKLECTARQRAIDEEVHRDTELAALIASGKREQADRISISQLASAVRAFEAMLPKAWGSEAMSIIVFARGCADRMLSRCEEYGLTPDEIESRKQGRLIALRAHAATLGHEPEDDDDDDDWDSELEDDVDDEEDEEYGE